MCLQKRMSVKEQNQEFYKEACIGSLSHFKKKLEEGMEDAFMMNSALNDWNEMSEEDRNRRTDYFRTNADPSWLCAPAWADYQEDLRVGDGAYKISKAYNEEIYKNITEFYQEQHNISTEIIEHTQKARKFKAKEIKLRGIDKQNKESVYRNVCDLPDEIVVLSEEGRTGVLDMVYVRANIVHGEKYMRFCREHRAVLEWLTELKVEEIYYGDVVRELATRGV